ncbi:MAG TPA: asparagine synthase-related protein, partial [Acidobacteriaceae bacterium]|nr:asparagine synthase-related protein [Acidobacteriaceae bacterium]
LSQPEQLPDSAVLLAAWVRWGSSCVDKLLGAFAFAVWTPGRHELFAARDHTGERPLHYRASDSLFALASLPQALVTPESAGFDGERIATWLGCVAPDRDRSFFSSVRRLPAGHMLHVTREGVKCTQYWHPRDAKPTSFRRDSEYAEALIDVLDRATEARLRGTAPVGCTLSAGLDSAAVCSSAATLLARYGQPLTAFTAVPRREFTGASEPWQIPSEGAGAAELARMYPNIDHVLVDSAGRDLLGTMKQWTDAMGEPALNVVNLLWLSATFETARNRGIRVVLEGGSGNGTISWGTNAVLGSMLRRLRWGKLLQTTAGLHRNGAISWRAAARASLAGLLPPWCDSLLLPTGAAESLYRPLMREDLPHARRIRERIYENSFGVSVDPVAEQAKMFEWFDFGSVRAAIQSIFDIDVRDPTADKRVYEFCFSIPPEQYVVGGHSRSLIRRALKGRVPEATRLSYKRGLQGADWFLTMSEALPDLRAEVAEIEASPAVRQWIDVRGLHTMLDSWPKSGYESAAVSNRWHNALTRAVSLGYFLRSHDPELQRADIAHAVRQHP